MVVENKEQKLERIVLDSDSTIVIKEIMNQVSSELGDIVYVTQKVIANFIIKNRMAKLTEQELDQLKSENYDLVKALKRATGEAIKAKQNGTEINLNDVLKIIQTPSVIATKAPRKPRTEKKKAKDSNLLNQPEFSPENT